ncbi:DsbA family protein [Natronorarus salvus]|uniref:DsbA family protein n=1 Tax=Natronorarus salvus TaxID=3117733 RepID=UPI002F26B63E
MDDGFPPDRNTSGSRRSRRAVLAAAAAAGLSGCLGSGALDIGGSDDDPDSAVPADDTESPNATDSANETDSSEFDLEEYETDGSDDEDDGNGKDSEDGENDPEPVDPVHTERFTVDYGHPVADGLGRRPFLGSLPEETGAVVVEFEDASCQVCARFHERTFPEFETELIDSGRVTFVTRQFPRTAAWAEPATHALEATFARDEPSFWELRGEYYDAQDSLNDESVLDHTRGFLRGTDVDGEAVAEDVEDGTFDPMVDLDLDVRRRAGFFRTPSFFLFREGEFLTRIVGNQPVSVFESALQV